MNTKEIAKVTFNLVVIYVIGGLLLAWVYSMTSPIIFKNKKEDKANALKGMMPFNLVINAPAAKLDAVRAMLPEGVEATERDGGIEIVMDLYKKEKKKLVRKIKKTSETMMESSDFNPGEPKGTWEIAHKTAEYFEVTDKKGDIIGYIVESYHKGYSGAPGIYVAIDKDLKIQKLEILTHTETPGLGDVIEEAWFKNQFKGKTLGQLEVVKGETDDKIQAITGATISTRAITYGARDAVDLMGKFQRGELPAPEHEADGAVKEDTSGH